MRVIERIKILPLLVIVAFISMSIRVNGVADSLEAYFNKAQANQDEASTPPPFPDKDKIQAKEEKEEKKETIHDDISKTPEGADTPEIEWQDSSDMDISYSSIKMELFNDLSERRKKLEQKEQEIIKREALLKAAEKELDRKYHELNSIKNEINILLKQQTDEEEKRIKSLVKIYEGMKAKDAARIFNTLDMDILVRVMAGMSERKLSPILASMEPDRARSVTILLAEQKSLPSISQK